jgi:hypothetical protein
VIPDTARYAPGHAIAAVVVWHESGSGDTLAAWPAVLISLLYAAALCLAGFVVVTQSDVPSGGV